MTRLVSVRLAALFVATISPVLLACPGGGGGGGKKSGSSISGSVVMPAGQAFARATPGLLDRMGESLFPKAHAALSGQVLAGGGLTVFLYEVDPTDLDDTSKYVEVARTRTNASGVYRFNRAAALNQIVAVQDDLDPVQASVFMRALPGTRTANIDPLSEFLVRLLDTEIFASGGSLEDLTAGERESLGGRANFLDVFVADGSSLDAAVASVEGDPIAGELQTLLLDYKEPGSSLDRLSGSYKLVGLDVDFATSEMSAATIRETLSFSDGRYSVSSRVVEAVVHQPIPSNAPTATLSTTTLGGTTGTYTVLASGEAMLMPEDATRGATRAIVDLGGGSEIAVLSNPLSSSPRDSDLGFLVKRGSGLNDGILDGIYSAFRYEITFKDGQPDLSSGIAIGTATFDGSGAFNYEETHHEFRAGGRFLTQRVQSESFAPGTYDVAGDGSFSGSTNIDGAVRLEGVAEANGQMAVASYGERHFDFGGDTVKVSLILFVKRGPGAAPLALEGSYGYFGIDFGLEMEENGTDDRVRVQVDRGEAVFDRFGDLDLDSTGVSLETNISVVAPLAFDDTHQATEMEVYEIVDDGLIRSLGLNDKEVAGAVLTSGRFFLVQPKTPDDASVYSLREMGWLVGIQKN